MGYLVSSTTVGDIYWVKWAIVYRATKNNRRWKQGFSLLELEAKEQRSRRIADFPCSLTEN